MTDTRDALLQRRLGGDRLSRRDFVKRATALGLSLPAISALLAACGGDDDDDGSTTPTAASGAATPSATGVTANLNVTVTAASAGLPTPTPGGVAGTAGGKVTFARAADSTLMDPPGNILNTDIWIFDSIYDRLITTDEKGTGLIPSLAEKWEVAADSMTYTFHIRQGVKFSDGSDLTTDDIVFTLNRSKNKADSPWKFSLDQLKDASAPDASTVVVTLTQVWAPFLSDLSLFSNNILSKAFVDTNGEAALAQQTLGTGPFMLKEWKLGESLTLAKNPNYWVAGQPLVDEVTFLVVPDGNNEILQLQGGSIDGIVGQLDLPFNRIPDLEKDSSLQVIKFLSTYNNYVGLNCRKPPLDNVAARQALNYATDKQALIDTILFGNAEISNGYMPNGALYWNPDIKPYPHDVDKAKQLLSTTPTPDGFPLTMTTQSGNQIHQQLATELQSMWAEIGVELTISPVDPATYGQKLVQTFDFDAIPSGWTHDIIDPDEIVSIAILPDSQQSWGTGWTNQKVFDLANQGRATLDDAERRQIYYQIQQMHFDDAPLVFLYVIPYIVALNKKIQGFFQSPMGQYDLTKMFVQS